MAHLLTCPAPFRPYQQPPVWGPFALACNGVEIMNITMLISMHTYSTLPIIHTSSAIEFGRYKIIVTIDT
eukprot:17316-Heterococcus_DN1.PRE.2